MAEFLTNEVVAAALRATGDDRNAASDLILASIENMNPVMAGPKMNAKKENKKEKLEGVKKNDEIFSIPELEYNQETEPIWFVPNAPTLTYNARRTQLTISIPGRMAPVPVLMMVMLFSPKGKKWVFYYDDQQEFFLIGFARREYMTIENVAGLIKFIEARLSMVSSVVDPYYQYFRMRGISLPISEATPSSSSSSSPALPSSIAKPNNRSYRMPAYFKPGVFNQRRILGPNNTTPQSSSSSSSSSSAAPTDMVPSARLLFTVDWALHDKMNMIPNEYRNIPTYFWLQAPTEEIASAMGQAILFLKKVMSQNEFFTKIVLPWINTVNEMGSVYGYPWMIATSKSTDQLEFNLISYFDNENFPKIYTAEIDLTKLNFDSEISPSITVTIPYNYYFAVFLKENTSIPGFGYAILNAENDQLNRDNARVNQDVETRNNDY